MESKICSENFSSLLRIVAILDVYGKILAGLRLGESCFNIFGTDRDICCLRVHGQLFWNDSATCEVPIQMVLIWARTVFL